MSRVSDARAQLDAWEAKRPGDYTSQYKDKIDGVMGKLDGMKDFSYDPTRDAAYEQYKNSYTRQAKLANENAQANASAISALLRDLSMRKGLLGQIFAKAQNKIQDPAKLSRLVAMIDETKWTRLGVDVKGDIYEGILEKNAEDTKSGAGQYFTPRALIQTIVECVRPQADTLIADPAAGTGGFLLAAYSYLEKHANLNTDQKERLKKPLFFIV